jgi:hypothetical protein
MAPQQVKAENAWRGEAAKYMAIAEKRPLTLREQQMLQMALLKARQACDALELCDPGSSLKASPKLDEFEALVAEIASQGTSKVLVFSEWVQMLKLAAARLDKLGIGYAMLTGEVPPEKRPALLDRFREDSGQQVLLSSDAGGVGLNLQVANYVVHLDLPWNPARLDQRTSRAHRLGQTRGVSVTYLCAEQGIERGIEGTLASKRAVRSAALDPGSEVETLESQGFSVFLRQMKETLDALEAPAPEAEAAPVEDALLEAEPIEAEAGRVEAETAAAPTSPPETFPPTPAPSSAGDRSRNRLRLARVVLEAGFPGDAVKASYEALAAAVSGMADTAPPTGHAALVAVMYRDLVPKGRLAAAVPGVLARLHDLTTLEAQGIDVDVALAQEAVAEAESWVERLSS